MRILTDKWTFGVCCERGFRTEWGNTKISKKPKKKISPSGNWTRVSRVTGANTDHYTKGDWLLCGFGKNPISNRSLFSLFLFFETLCYWYFSVILFNCQQKLLDLTLYVFWELCQNTWLLFVVPIFSFCYPFTCQSQDIWVIVHMVTIGTGYSLRKLKWAI